MELTAETATLADAIQKAARVAPVKGAAFDRAHGVVLELDDGSTLGTPTATVKATDLDTTYLQRVPLLESKGSGKWRLPSAVLAGFMSQLPLGHGAHVTLRDKDDRVEVIAGKTRAKFRHSDPDGFPRFDWFDPDGLAVVPNFAQRVQQVAWSTDRDHEVLGGVNVDGEHLTATDRVKLAQVPCEVPVDHPITVPLTSLAGVMKNTSEVRLAAVGDRLHMMTDEDSQATSIIIAQPYPDVSALRKLVDNATFEARINCEALRIALNRMLVLCKNERYPLVTLQLSRDAMDLEMDVPDLGIVNDQIEIIDQRDDDFTLHFTPSNLLGVLNAAKAESITMRYGPIEDPPRPTLWDDGGGFTCVVMPRRKAVRT